MTFLIYLGNDGSGTPRSLGYFPSMVFIFVAYGFAQGRMVTFYGLPREELRKVTTGTDMAMVGAISFPLVASLLLGEKITIMGVQHFPLRVDTA